MSVIITIRYSGTESSCLLLADRTGKTLTATIGDVGAESEDPAFGDAGVLDLTADEYDTIADLVSTIEGYDDYSASVFSGDGTLASEDILEATVQAAGVDAYLIFEPESILNPYALVSWEIAQKLLGYDDSQRFQVEWLLNAITTVAESTDYSARQLASRSYDEYYPGPGGDILVLVNRPVRSLSALYIDRLRVFGADTEIIESDYDLDAGSGLVYLLSGKFPEGRKVIRAVYEAGFNPIPDDLQLAAIETLSWNMKRLGSSGVGLKSQSVDGVAVEYELTIPVSAQRVFESYRGYC